LELRRLKEEEEEEEGGQKLGFKLLMWLKLELRRWWKVRQVETGILNFWYDKELELRRWRKRIRQAKTGVQASDDEAKSWNSGGSGEKEGHEGQVGRQLTHTALRGAVVAMAPRNSGWLENVVAREAKLVACSWWVAKAWKEGKQEEECTAAM
jgi:hypothetical protein